MPRDILLVLDEADQAAAPYALSLARLLEARIAALRPRRDPSLMTDGSLEARYELARGDQGERAARARAELADFAAQAAAAGIEAETIGFDGPAPIQPRDVPMFARAFDLVVVQQAEAGRPPDLNDLAGAVLSGGGRPVVVVPGIQREPARLERVVAAWDGSAASARAIGDAAPLLERAKFIEFVAVNAAGTSQFVVAGGERLARRFERSGVEARFRHIPGEGDPANVLLSHVADVNADLIVAGGYGHSRLREAILGGVTRTLLASMTVPVFMSH